ncbi:MAG: hypothetical protein R6U96_17280 [Promethearchaeia archaeon]
MPESILKKFYTHIKMEQKGDKISDSSYEKQQKKELQKKKFNILLTLVQELFSKKNSNDYNTISNLILASLHSFRTIAVDDYHSKKLDGFNKNTSLVNRILAQEFGSEVEEFQKFITLGKEFQNLVQNFLDQYAGAENVIFPPKK